MNISCGLIFYKMNLPDSLCRNQPKVWLRRISFPRMHLQIKPTSKPKSFILGCSLVFNSTKSICYVIILFMFQKWCSEFLLLV
mmetsp:Transcript_9857/g.15147  ORF Transcript_9857/g.15147 Transcript_9857/m.15147 type:complete len:83 (-) Transcript_9857:872-1120(-)